ncbi:MAG: cache domain-containing protein [Candidatus Anammoxibacter sp.]
MPVKKIFFVIAAALLIFLLAVPLVSYKTLKRGIKHEVFRHLITTRELTNDRIASFFNERFGDIDVLTRNPIVIQSFSQLSNTANNGIDSDQYSAVANLYLPLMEHYCIDYGYVNIFFAEKDGKVIFSVNESEYIGQNLLKGDYSDFSISHVFNNALEEVTFDDFTFHEELNTYTFFFGAPVYNEDVLLGVIIIEIPFSHMDAILTQRKGLGKTGEIYLVGDDGYMRSNSRFSEEPTILKKEVDTEATREAFIGNIGTMIMEDYRGVSVLSAYTPLNLKFVDWVLLAEIDEKEAFASIRKVEFRLVIIAFMIGGIAIAYIYITRKKSKIDDGESKI